MFRLALIGALALIARVVYGELIAADLPLGSDAIWYSLQASTISGGNGYVDPATYFGSFGDAVPTAAFPPLWPLLLSLVSWVGVASDQAFRIVGAVIGTSTVVLTGFLGRAVAGPTCGLVAAAIVAGSPLLMAADGSTMSDSLAVALITAAALAATVAMRTRTPTAFVVVGALGGFATLARSDSLLYLALLVVAMHLGRTRTPTPTRREMALPLVSLVVAGLLVVPWMVRNQIELGRPVLSTNLGSLIEGANCSTTYSGRLIGMWDRECDLSTRNRTRTETWRMSRGVSNGVDHAADSLARLPVVAVVRVARAFGLWNPVTQAREEAIETRDERWQMVAWGYALVALVLGSIGAVLLWRRRAPGWPIAAVALASVLVVVVSWGNSRFRLAAVPAIGVAAAFFVTTELGRLRRCRGATRATSAVSD